MGRRCSFLFGGGEAGQHDRRDARFAIDRLHNPSEARTHDSSGMGVGSDRDDNDGSSVSMLPLGEVRMDSVRALSLEEFRNRLVTHFDIAFKKREIVWPARNGVSRQDNTF